MRSMLMTVLAGLMFAAFIPAVEKTTTLAGTWIFDPSQSDSGGQMRRSRSIGFPGSGGGMPGIGIPGIGFPRAGNSGGRRAGGYPGGRDGDDGEGTGGEGMPREQIRDMTLQISQTADEVQTTRKYTVNGDFKTVAQRFLLDGSESNNPASNGRGEFVSRSTWKNGKLVNTGTQNVSMRGQSYDMPVKEEYSISKDGKVLTIKTTRTTPRGEMSSKQVFNREEGSSESSAADSD